jgi:hypothetical protein
VLRLAQALNRIFRKDLGLIEQRRIVSHLVSGWGGRREKKERGIFLWRFFFFILNRATATNSSATEKAAGHWKADRDSSGPSEAAT